MTNNLNGRKENGKKCPDSEFSYCLYLGKSVENMSLFLLLKIIIWRKF